MKKVISLLGMILLCCGISYSDKSIYNGQLEIYPLG